jgi:bifunctional pyridoxal-dependent enzyme with beta-cystathionase and maltose regulon repressor activities
MIHFKNYLSQTDAKWVLEEAFPVFVHRIAHPTLSRIAEAHNKVFEEQVGIPGCSCEYKATHQVWTSRLGQYKSQIEAIAYPPVVVEPSEIIVEAVTEVQTLPNEIRVKTRKSAK